MDAIAVDDRGLAYGDGVFETMRAHRGDLPWWDAHWARLARGGERLALALPDPTQVREQAGQMLADGGDWILKLIVTRGGRARGYAPDNAAQPHWLLSRHAVPARRDDHAKAGGLRLHWCSTGMATQPALAGIKHCNRLEQVLARAECMRMGADEGLMCDTEGRVVAATSANLFVLQAGQWTTPLLDRCGVAGTCRAHLLAPLQAREGHLQPRDVELADAVFLCNAVRGILPAASLGTRIWQPHPGLARARHLLAELHPGFAPETE
ncbi:MAG: aminodeoxychorismate lyase [Luteimonas sp.]